MDNRQQVLESVRNRDSFDNFDGLNQISNLKTSAKVKRPIIKEKTKKFKYTSVKEKSDCPKKD